jgi:hypothetical protein
MTTFAEDLTAEYNRDDIKLAELLVKADSARQDLAEVLAYAFVNRDWAYLIRYIDVEIAGEVAERQRENDDRMIAEYDGREPQR